MNDKSRPDIEQRGRVVGLQPESRYAYKVFRTLAFPQIVQAGIRIAKLGNTSVCYKVGLFALGAPLTAAKSHFIHVYVDRQKRRSTVLPVNFKRVLEQLL